MKNRITLKKKSDPEKFAISCLVKGIEFPHALCDTGASVSILPRVMADQLGLKVEPSNESFTFLDCSPPKGSYQLFYGLVDVNSVNPLRFLNFF